MEGPDAQDSVPSRAPAASAVTQRSQRSSTPPRKPKQRLVVDHGGKYGQVDTGASHHVCKYQHEPGFKMKWDQGNANYAQVVMLDTGATHDIVPGSSRVHGAVVNKRYGPTARLQMAEQDAAALQDSRVMHRPRPQA